MMKHSARILVYEIEDNRTKVLLCHMGDPYWQNINQGAWSIPKGEFKKEKAMDATIREFQEETGFHIDKYKLNFLGSKKQSNSKLVTVFSAIQDFDTAKAKSNAFTKEWPKVSGKFQEFPEMDRAEWLDIEMAKRKILKGQVYFLPKLEGKLNMK